MLTPPPNTRLLTILFFLYTGLLIYASLMPFNFSSMPDFDIIFTNKFWSQWPFNLRGRISGSDLLSNLTVYIPFGFLLATRFILTDSKAIGTALLLPVFFCAVLSLAIETLQSGIGIRVPSVSDWLLNCLSSLIGALLGLILGRSYYSKLLIWFKTRWSTHPLDIISLALLLLICADSLAPFLPTIKLSQVWKSVKRSHFDILSGFGQHPWHWWLVVKLQIYHILTLLLVFWNGASAQLSRRLKIASLVVILALILECLKLLITSRQFNMANIAVAAAGAFLGLLTATIAGKHLGKKTLLSLAMISLLLYLLYLGWTPFDFNVTLSHAKLKLPSSIIELFPFYHYAMGATLEHVRLFIQNCVLSGIFIYLLRLRIPAFDQSSFKLTTIMLICLAIGIAQEGGQLFLSGRTPSMTDIYCFMLGGYLGSRAPKAEGL